MVRSKNAAGALALAGGFLLLLPSALSVPLLTDKSCRESTQIHRTTCEVADCNSDITCDNPDNLCERRANTGTITYTYCSCIEISSGDPFPGAVCHAYRRHEGTNTTKHCNNEGCDAGYECDWDDPQVTWLSCACKQIPP